MKRVLLVVLVFAGACSSDSSPSAPTAQPMTFFVTSQTSTTGNLGGLAGADALCDRLAASVGQGNRFWRAYLSVERDASNNNQPTNAKDRIGIGPWHNAAGALVAGKYLDTQGRYMWAMALSKSPVLEEFQKALAMRDDPEIRQSLERATLEARTARGFDQKRLSHFIVSYEGETMESTGRMVLDALERSRASLISQLGYEPQEPVVVILYSQRSYREMGGPHWSAGYFDGKIRMPVCSASSPSVICR